MNVTQVVGVYGIAIILSFNSFAIAGDVSDSDWEIVREQVEYMEAEYGDSEEAQVWWWRQRHMQMLLALDEIDRAWAILDTMEGSTRRGNLMVLARDCVKAGRAELALHFFGALDEPTWRDIKMLAYVARDDIDFAPFDAILPKPMTAEERWLALSVNWDTAKWIDAYEEGKQIETFEYSESASWMIRLWLNATQFSEYEDDELLWSTEPYESNRLAASVCGHLFRDDQCNRAFEILKLSNANVRERELRSLIDTWGDMRTTTFPDRRTLSRYLRPHEQHFVDELLAAAAVGNHDWEAAIAIADECTVDWRQGQLLTEILLTSTAADEFVPELLEYETTILDDQARVRDHAAFLKLELMAGIRDNISRRLDAVSQLFESDGLAELAIPILAEIADEADRDRIVAIVRSTDDGFPDFELASAYLVLQEDEDYRRLFHRDIWDDETDPCPWNPAKMALLKYLKRISSLADRIAVIDRLDLGHCGFQMRQSAVYEFLAEHDQLVFEEMLISW